MFVSFWGNSSRKRNRGEWSTDLFRKVGTARFPARRRKVGTRKSLPKGRNLGRRSTQKNLRFLKKLFRLLILILYLPIFIQRRVVESDFLSVRDSLFEESRDPSLKRFFIFVFCNQEKFS
ncbi:hypothetical protein EFP84_16495 [Leptospira kmetyi]|uniref:Uncharacterized protein n=1 Tax=Leptospira kmetyi TaxID=408139 RepID=A0AAD0UPX4_9LEPT|nr:hypothetical protein EFP84_16495 [Leptospira kmetyi]